MTTATLTMDGLGTMAKDQQQAEAPGMERFSAWLRRHMESRGLSQRQVAAYADVAPTTIGLWLKGYSVPQSHSLKKLADGLGQGVTYNFLVGLIDANLEPESSLQRYDATYQELDTEIAATAERLANLLRRRHGSAHP